MNDTNEAVHQLGSPERDDVESNPPDTQAPTSSAEHDETEQKMDGLTVLICKGDDHTASKRFTRDGERWIKTDFDLGFRFRPAPYGFNCLSELAELIEEIREHHNAVVVRGELTDEARAAIAADSEYTIARRKNDRGDGVPVSLVEVPRHWIMVDIDSYPLPPDADLSSDPRSIVDRAVRDLLPTEFHEAECFFQLSSSCGFAHGVLKAHLFFWLSRPEGNEHLRAVFKQHAPLVDRAVFNAVQPHYLADPIIEGGDDPIPRRTGWRHGSRSDVSLPDPTPSGGGGRGNETDNRVAGVGARISNTGLSRLGDGDGLDGFHAPLLATSMQYAIRCSKGGVREDAAFISDLREKIEAAPRRPDRISIAAYTDEHYLSRLITGAFALISKGATESHDSSESAVQWPPGFGMTTTGLWFTDPAKEDANSEWVSAPFAIEGECEDGDGGSWGVVMRWNDPVGRLHRWIVPRAMLHTEPGAIAGSLDANGLRCNPSRPAQQALRRVLASVRPEKRLQAVERAGWHGSNYVMADGTVYGQGDVILRPELMRSDRAFASTGSLDDWKQRVARYAVGNSRLVLFISTALAAPLLDIAVEPSGGVHLYGQSQSGKSTAIFVAASVWGKGARDGAVHQWRATSNGLEGLAARCSDNLIALDEISQADAKHAGESIYTLANGQGKQRANQHGAARQRLNWRVLFASSGEVTLAQKMAETGKRPMTGMEVRLVNVSADAGQGMGIFETLHEFDEPGALADYLRETCASVYGTAGRAFLVRLIEERNGDEDWFYGALKRFRQRFIKDNVPNGAAGQVRSVAGRLGLIAAAGEVATAFGILPWPEGEATKAAKTALVTWLADRGGAEAGEEQIAIRQVRAFIEAHGMSRFAVIRRHVQRLGGELTTTDELDDRLINNRAGWRRFDRVQGRWEYFVSPEAWKNEVCCGIDPTDAARALYARGWLCKGDGDHFAKQESIPEAGRPRVYVVLGTILEGKEAG